MFPRAVACEEPAIHVETPVSDDEQAFRAELSLVARKAFELRQSRFSVIKSINDSYNLTAEAIMLLAERGDVKNAIPLLREATKRFNGNRLAYLLLGSAFERSGQREEAARYYANFYRYSLTLAPVENRLIGPSSLQIFRRYVEMRFTEWGRTLPEPKIPLGIHEVRSLLMLEESQAGQLINLILPLLVVAGFVILLLARMAQIELPAAVAYFLVSFYLLVVLAYLLWVAHFFLGLPFFISLETEFVLLFGGGIVVIPALYAGGRLLASRMETKIEGTKRCPHCKATILNVAIECPKCKRSCSD